MYKLNAETQKHIDDIIRNTIGISYEEFERLDYDKQQELIKEYHKKQPQETSDTVKVMIGEGEDSIFIDAKKGELVLVGEGEHSIFVRAGITPEEEIREVDDKLDELLYSKPVSFVKRLKRKIRK